MKQRCKNCSHYSWTIEGNAWCEKRMQYTNEDGCCNSYDNEKKETLVAGVVVAFVCALLVLLIKCCI